MHKSYLKVAPAKLNIYILTTMTEHTDSKRSQTGRHNVLIVDNERDFNHGLVDLLTWESYAVKFCHNTKDAIEAPDFSEEYATRDMLQKLETMVARSVTSAVNVQYFLHENLWCTEVDPGEFQDVILNLVINTPDT
ncbi:MAG TPA: hypothetical protein ENJ08_14925 [Gammaproteobacteria bacterium]|nr:hypothetical protein [Gammaproteobacteria bacterium]